MFATELGGALGKERNKADRKSASMQHRLRGDGLQKRLIFDRRLIRYLSKELCHERRRRARRPSALLQGAGGQAPPSVARPPSPARTQRAGAGGAGGPEGAH